MPRLNRLNIGDPATAAADVEPEIVAVRDFFKHDWQTVTIETCQNFHGQLLSDAGVHDDKSVVHVPLNVKQGA